MVYKSPLDMARLYLGDNTPDEEEQKFISDMTSQGYDENAYLPAIASKRMRKEDLQLASMYDSYQKSPTGFLTGLVESFIPKTKLKETTGKVDATMQFLGNLIKGVPSTIAGIGDAISHPIDTVKGVASVASAYDPSRMVYDYGKGLVTGKKSTSDRQKTRDAMANLIEENFGTMDKAAETFYQNPFEIIQMFVGGGASKAGKLSQVTRNAENISDIASDASKISKLKDLTNWDIHLMSLPHDVKNSKLGQSINKKISKFGMGQENALGNITEKASTPEGMAALSKYEKFTPEQNVSEMNKIQPMLQDKAKTAMNTAEDAIRANPELGKTKLPEASQVANAEHNILSNAGLKMSYVNEGPKAGTNLRFSAKNEGGPISVPKAQVVEAEDVINAYMKEAGMSKSNKNFDFTTSDAAMGKLNSYLATNPNPIVASFRDYIRNTQNQVFPTIREARDTYNSLFSESPIKDSSGNVIKSKGLLPRVNEIIGDASADPVAKGRKLSNIFRDEREVLRPELKQIADMTDVDLEAMALALSANKTVGSKMLGAASLGSVITGAGTAMLSGDWASLGATLAGLGAVGTVLNSPSFLYKVAKMKGASKALAVEALSKGTSVPVLKINKAMSNIASAFDKAGINSSNIKDFLSIASGGLGVAKETAMKTPRNRQLINLVESINQRLENEKKKGEISSKRSDLQEQASTMEKSLQGIQPKTPQEQPIETTYTGEQYDYAPGLGQAGYQ